MTSNLETDTNNDIEKCYSKSELKIVMDGWHSHWLKTLELQNEWKVNQY